MFTDILLDETRANAICKSDGCSNTVIKPYMVQGKRKPWYNYMTRCKACQHNMHKYKITTPQRDNLLALQSGKCKICSKTISFADTTAQIDHCHTTGRVRGVLCFRCNTAIGSFNDDITIMANAITYLKETNEQLHT